MKSQVHIKFDESKHNFNNEMFHDWRSHKSDRMDYDFAYFLQYCLYLCGSFTYFGWYSTHNLRNICFHLIRLLEVRVMQKLFLVEKKFQSFRNFHRFWTFLAIKFLIKLLKYSIIFAKFLIIFIPQSP